MFRSFCTAFAVAAGVVCGIAAANGLITAGSKSKVVKNAVGVIQREWNEFRGASQQPGEERPVGDNG
jgi:hypothetical protein